MTQASPVWPRRRVPKAPIPPSSSPTTKWPATLPRSRTPEARMAASAATLATTPAFMSQAPRPCTTSPRTLGTKGAPAHCARSPGGTTSTWPWRIMVGPSSAPGSVATSPHASSRGTSMPGKPGSLRRAGRSIDHRSMSRPDRPRSRARRCCSSDSAALPVTLGTARVSSSIVATAVSSTASTAADSSALSTARMPHAPFAGGRRGGREDATNSSGTQTIAVCFRLGSISCED